MPRHALTTEVISTPVTKSTNYTLASLSDANALIQFDSTNPCSLTIPTDATLNFAIGTELEFLQVGVGLVTVDYPKSNLAIGVRATNTYVGTTFTQSYPIAIPSGVQSGDGIMVLLQVPVDDAVFATPSGWSVVGVQSNGPTGAKSSLFKKINAQSNDSSTVVNFTHTGTACPAAAVIVVLSGVSLVDFIDGVNPAGAFTGNANLAPPLTTVSAGAIELSMMASSSGPTPSTNHTIPTGLVALGQAHTSLGAANSGVAIARGALTGLPAGTTIGSRQWPVGLYGAARTVAIKPNASGGVEVLASGDVFTTSNRYTGGRLKKIAANKWLLSGLVQNGSGPAGVSPDFLNIYNLAKV